jgi:ABC-type glycerol-3-phosphate transport system substrate-binding protein
MCGIRAALGLGYEERQMKTLSFGYRNAWPPSLAALALVFGVFTMVRISNAAAAKPTWQAEWEKTVAAAKKEGKLNFYVGRYGSEPLLNEFRKEFPEIKLVTVNGSGSLLGTRIITELRAGNVVADLFRLRAQSSKFKVRFAPRASSQCHCF